MADLEKAALTGKPLNPSAEWALEIALVVAKHNGGNLYAAVMGVLFSLNRLNEAIITNQNLQQVAHETNERYQAVCARLAAL